jgi:hypothetical protein
LTNLGLLAWRRERGFMTSFGAMSISLVRQQFRKDLPPYPTRTRPLGPAALGMAVVLTGGKPPAPKASAIGRCPLDHTISFAQNWERMHHGQCVLSVTSTCVPLQAGAARRPRMVTRAPSLHSFSVATLSLLRCLRDRHHGTELSARHAAQIHFVRTPRAQSRQARPHCWPVSRSRNQHTVCPPLKFTRGRMPLGAATPPSLVIVSE